MGTSNICRMRLMHLWYRIPELGRPVAGYPLILLLAFISGMVIPARAQDVVLDRAVAVVNNRPVLISEVNEHISRLLHKSNPLEINSEIPLSRERIIQQLIDEELIQQEAERLNIQVTPEDLEKTIEEIKKRNQMNTSQLILELAKDGIPFRQYCKDLKREIRKSIIIRREIINHIIINDAMIQEAFEARKDKHQNSLKIRLRQIFQPFNPDSSDAEKKALRLEMEKLLTLLKKEGNFDLMAKRYSKGPNAPHGGDMGWIQLKDIAKHLADAIRKLKKGETSGLIESLFGIHIIKVDDIQQMAGPSHEEIKENLRKELFEKEFQKRYEAWIKELREAAHIEIRF